LDHRDRQDNSTSPKKVETKSMSTTRREVIGLFGGVAAGALFSGTAALGAAQRRLGSKEKTLYWAATVTPCNRSGRFDAGALQSIMQWQKAQGADGVVVLGTSGEFPSFSVAERKEIAEAALKNKQGLNVIIGSGTSNIAETIELSRHAQANGADGLLVIPPFYFNEPPLDGLIAYYEQLFEAVTIPINLYHIPYASEVSISHPLLQRLMKFPHLAGIKDSSGDPQGFAKFLQSFPDLNMRSGTDNNVELALSSGMGAILAEGNMFSKKCADIFTTYRSKGDWKSAVGKLSAAMQVLSKAPGVDDIYSYGAMKHMLSLQMGGGDWYARVPYAPLSDATKKAIGAAIARANSAA
jgi:4-hydroxy-tetrahydrodipicolinate synthase